MKLRIPDYFPKGRQIDRQYFFNVLNTVHRADMKAILKYAFDQRNSSEAEQQRAETIQISQDWLQRLEDVPFKSSKLSSILTMIQRKMARLSSCSSKKPRLRKERRRCPGSTCSHRDKSRRSKRSSPRKWTRSRRMSRWAQTAVLATRASETRITNFAED